MKIDNRYVFFLVLISCLVNTLLAFFGHEELSTYLIINIISFLVLTFIFTPTNPKARMTFNALSMIFFISFLVIVIMDLPDIFKGK
ncbi:MAG: hypothetical protein JSU79_04345 [Dehalococcoidales bacterium]|nr:MAG: hypothetical protein JSU79_04345 [Dehalococcoidales bacterium]